MSTMTGQPILPPRTRTTCAGCDRRRLCFSVPVRGYEEIRVPYCEECLIELPRDPDDPTRLA